MTTEIQESLGPFGKFFARAFTGSMRGKGSHVFAVMAYAISNARPPHGEVELNPEDVASRIGDSVKKIEQAIDYLCSDDPKTRTHVENGKRLLKIGTYAYILVNFSKYRQRQNDEERREYFRIKMAESRARARGVKPPVKDVKVCTHPLTQAEAEAEAEAEREREHPPSPSFEAERPSLKEWSEYCQRIGLADMAYAKDKFLSAESDNWSRKNNWRAYAARCRTWWESERKTKRLDYAP